MKIGVTGHQEIENQIAIWLKHSILDEIKKYPIEKGFTSLAIGADQLFAQILIDNYIPVVAIIPSEDYSLNFDKKHLSSYLILLKKVESIIQLDYEESSENVFYRAGKIISENSDILFAVWNGLPAKGLGGTADIVEYSKILGKKIIHFDTLKRKVKYINF